MHGIRMVVAQLCSGAQWLQNQLMSTQTWAQDGLLHAVMMYS